MWRGLPRWSPRLAARFWIGSNRRRNDHPGKSPWRSVLPFASILIGVLLLLADHLLLGGALHTAQALVACLVLVLAEATRVTLATRRTFETEIWRGSASEIPGLPLRAALCALVLLMLPLAHFCGFGSQLVRQVILRIPPDIAEG